MRNFKSYNEFITFCDTMYEWDKDTTCKNYRISPEDKNPLYYETMHCIHIHKKSNKWYKRLFNIKEYDTENSTYGFELNPIVQIKTLCPMIEKVDIVYRAFNNQLYERRIDPKNIYFY